MGSIFIIQKKAQNLAIAAIVKTAMNEMDSPFSQFSDTWCDQEVGLGYHLFQTNSASKGELISDVDENLGCLIVADARIDYRIELLQKLDKRNVDDHSMTDSRLILMSYLKWGEDCVKHLEGDFAFAIWDKRREKIFGARDHFGCRPLFYIETEDCLCISSDPKAFNSLPEFRYQIEEQFILDSICAISPRKESSAFVGINKLPPAHTLTKINANPVRINRYWDLTVQKEYANISENQAIRVLKDRFIEAIRQRSNPLGPIAVELSGGLDSSGVVICLRICLERDAPIYAFTHDLEDDEVVKPRGYASELKYSSKIVETCNIEKHFVVSGVNISGGLTAIEDYLKDFREPFDQGYALMSDLLYSEIDASGAKILLSGFGGDEGITYKGGGLIEELAARREFRKLHKEIRAKIIKNGGNLYLKLIKKYILLATPRLIQFFKKDWRNSWFKVVALDRKLSSKYEMKRRFFKLVYLPTDSDIRSRQYKRLMHPHIPNRIENSYFSAKAHGIEYRYPFLDIRLVEFFYSLPSELKQKNGIGRYLFRKAMEEIIPDEIRLRDNNTGVTIPNVMKRIVMDENIIRERIEEGRKNNKFHYIDYDKLHFMLDQFICETARKKILFGAKVFFNPIIILTLQKWQREGKIDIGIKC